MSSHFLRSDAGMLHAFVGSGTTMLGSKAAIGKSVASKHGAERYGKVNS